MKYTKDEAINEILKRGKAIKAKRDRALTALLSCSSLLCVIVMIAFIGVFAKTETETASMNYGAFILNAEAGLYVTVSLVCFILGIIAVIIFENVKRKAGSKI